MSDALITKVSDLQQLVREVLARTGSEIYFISLAMDESGISLVLTHSLCFLATLSIFSRLLYRPF